MKILLQYSESLGKKSDLLKFFRRVTKIKVDTICKWALYLKWNETFNCCSNIFDYTEYTSSRRKHIKAER